MKKVLDIVCCLLLLTACSKDNDETVTVDAPKGVATVTFLVTPNGLGDNGYNDVAAEGIFAYIRENLKLKDEIERLQVGEQDSEMKHRKKNDKSTQFNNN